MKRYLLLSCSARRSPPDGFQPLFNGKNLDGWDGDPRFWKVEGGEILGSTEGVTLNTIRS